jgi:hypothetical protein
MSFVHILTKNSYIGETDHILNGIAVTYIVFRHPRHAYRDDLPRSRHS